MGKSRKHIVNNGLTTSSNEGFKSDLADVTFVVPIRIDSRERNDNADSLIKYTFKHFETNFILLEVDENRKFYPKYEFDGFKYCFIKDSYEIFHRTLWINKLFSMATTTYVAVWDTDAIAPPGQIILALDQLRNGASVLSFPYDGRFYSCDKVSYDLFKQHTDIKILLKRIPVMHLMHGYHSVGGAFIVKKEQYLDAGGENENFYGWGPEDTERVKRMEVLGLTISYTLGALFHLFHPIGKNSWFANSFIERINRMELLKTSSLDKSKLNIISE